ncbi:MAG: UDP-N-acetylmuramoyl-L-alanyl-D-glutamate--2,6-diaminopimelate ligase [Actinomycetota bacterium]
MSRHDVQPIRAADAAAAVGGRVVGDPDRVIRGITDDSRDARDGDVFCCVRGERTDGHLHASQAVASGCRVLLCDRELAPGDLGGPVGPGHGEVTQIVVGDVRACLGVFADHVFGHPSQNLLMVGVTGTNGKTSTVAILASILAASGTATETIGTLTGVRTTPEPVDLHARLRDAVASGAGAVVMEVSSHALALGRVSGIRFAVAVFTNLSRDHLDFHGDMESYFAAKRRLFGADMCDRAVVNVDDEWGRRIVAGAEVPVSGFSPAALDDALCTADSVSFTWRTSRIDVPIGGRFTLANALGAIVAAEALGVASPAIAQGCARVETPTGRFESVRNGAGIDVIIDYAHTAESLEILLTSAREVCSGTLTVVFGCGGDRDAGKRESMGRAAALGADRVIVTSDNPREEDPMVIIEAVARGVRAAGCEPVIEPDRGSAIASAISGAERGDMVVIAGKGHETTQEIAGVHRRFVDAEVAAGALRDRAVNESASENERGDGA